jgi:glycosyltransferase involved in cell wall biosynthesis
MLASVVIPTHNRRNHILRAVRALLQQNYPRECYEIIVCCDRCTDGTANALRSGFGNEIHVCESIAPGQAGALNAGWQQARGQLVIFLDDEMEAARGFISGHALAHREAGMANIAVTGYSPVVVTAKSTPLVRQMANQYATYFQGLDQGERKNTPLDLCGCNFSVPVTVLRAVEGFNESYYFQRNDFELAVRLLQRGYEIRFSRAARADMHLAVTEEDVIGRAADRAKNDWRLATQYPGCVPYLPFFPVIHDPRRRRRWRLLWKTANVAVPIFSTLRKVFPHTLRLMAWEYASRYCLALREAAGSWQSFCSLAGVEVERPRGL